MDRHRRKANTWAPRASTAATLGWVVSTLIVVSAHAGFASDSSSDLTGVWQHIGKNGQTTLRILDNDTDVQVVVEGLNFLHFDEFRFVPDGIDRAAGARQVTSRRDGDSLITEFRRMGTTDTGDDPTEVVRSSEKFIWRLTDESTMTLTVSGSRGHAVMLAREFVFTKRDAKINIGYNTLEEEEE